MLAFYLSVLDEKVDKLNFEQICRKYDADVYRRIKSILRDEEDTREAMQETWLGVLQRMSVLRGKDEDSIKAYIMSIARNQGIAVLRKKQKESVLFSDIESEELIDDEDLFAICEDEGISRVMECINMLSESQREVIMMYYLYHHSLKEIAKMFNISETVAESRWNHGRARLMNLLIRRGVSKKTMAGIAAVLLIAFGCSMTVSAVRVPVVEFITNTYENFTEIFFNAADVEKAPDTIETVYTLGYVPEGYVEKECKISKISTHMVWTNKENEKIVFKQNVLDSYITTDNEYADCEIILIDEAQIFYMTEDSVGYYYWNSNEYVFYLAVPANVTNETAINLIQTLKIKK